MSARLAMRRVHVEDSVLERLRAACPVVTVDATQDWWPIALSWVADGDSATPPTPVVAPDDAQQVGDVIRICAEATVPVTVAGGRSGVCGGAIPLHGGIVLDLMRIAGLHAVDDESLVIDVAAGTVGAGLERTLRDDHGLTLGHWPQSIDLSTVGGWLACRAAGQLSTRYGKIEDMVVGLDAVTATGQMLTTGGQPRAAVGPDLTQLLVGSEGTLAVITGARLRVHPAPAATAKRAFAFDSFTAGVAACRRILRRGATPAVVRLYDETESERSFDMATNLLVLLDEGDPELVSATMAIAEAEAARAGHVADSALVDRWLEHRNDVSALHRFIEAGYVVDTMEVAGSWSALPTIHAEVVDAISGTEGVLAVSAHLSHAYSDGGCLYFTFGGRRDDGDKDTLYRACWDNGTHAALRAGASLSHHHGVGLNRARFMRDALGPAFELLVAVKRALDPAGILNPGKLGLPNPFAGTAEELAW